VFLLKPAKRKCSISPPPIPLPRQSNTQLTWDLSADMGVNLPYQHQSAPVLALALAPQSLLPLTHHPRHPRHLLSPRVLLAPPLAPQLIPLYLLVLLLFLEVSLKCHKLLSPLLYLPPWHLVYLLSLLCLWYFLWHIRMCLLHHLLMCFLHHPLWNLLCNLI
jgi:hypothetical protein